MEPLALDDVPEHAVVLVDSAPVIYVLEARPVLAQQVPLIRDYLDYFRAFLDLLAHASCELIRAVAYALYSERSDAPPPVLVIIVYVARRDQPMSARRDPRASYHPIPDGRIELRIQALAGRRPDQAGKSAGRVDVP